LKVLLIAPPIQDYYDTEIRHFPLGLLYLKAAINHFHPDVEVRIIDYHHVAEKTIPVALWSSATPESTLLKMTSRHSVHFTTITISVRHLTPSWMNKALLTLTWLASHPCLAPTILRYRRLHLGLKAVPPYKIVLGGAHASIMPEEIIKNGCADYVVIARANRPLWSLSATLRENVVSMMLPLWPIELMTR
jgi:radical SAM superfamily enzyme YgiQ (UPF0313 family)